MFERNRQLDYRVRGKLKALTLCFAMQKPPSLGSLFLQPQFHPAFCFSLHHLHNTFGRAYRTGAALTSAGQLMVCVFVTAQFALKLLGAEFCFQIRLVC